MSQPASLCGCGRCNLCAVEAACRGAPWTDPFRGRPDADMPPPAPKKPAPQVTPSLFDAPPEGESP